MPTRESRVDDAREFLFSKVNHGHLADYGRTDHEDIYTAEFHQYCVQQSGHRIVIADVTGNRQCLCVQCADSAWAELQRDEAADLPVTEHMVYCPVVHI